MIASRYETMPSRSRDFANSPKPNPDPPGYLEVIGMGMAWDHRVRNNAVLGVLASLQNAYYGALSPRKVKINGWRIQFAL